MWDMESNLAAIKTMKVQKIHGICLILLLLIDLHQGRWALKTNNLTKRK